MKKISLFLIAFCITGIIHSQVIPKPLAFGLKLGFNYNASDLKKENTSTITYTDVKSEQHIGFQGGIFLRVHLPKKLYLQEELYFAMKGGTFSYKVKPDPNLPIQDASQTIKLNTVDLPVLLGWKFVDLKVINIRLCGGPVASYVISKSVKIMQGGVDLSPASSNDAIKDVIWGAQAGIGFDILKLTVDCRYEIGLNNLTKNSTDAFKNNLINVSIGWKII